jgi:heme/copper-type cytochrome/quinol oxidase subunit 4
MPDYKGAPLDAERGPGLGCFWLQVVLLVALLVLTPVSVWLAAPTWLSAALLIIVLILLFFVGQTMIFLLRLVAADRRSRRRPMSSSARQTVGQIEDSVSDQDDATPDEPLT